MVSGKVDCNEFTVNILDGAWERLSGATLELGNGFFSDVMRAGGWYYKDRLGRSRGPMELVNLKTAWAAGIVDKNTFIWGDDMDEWAPIGMVYGLETAIATPDSNLLNLISFHTAILLFLRNTRNLFIISLNLSKCMFSCRF